MNREIWEGKELPPATPPLITPPPLYCFFVLFCFFRNLGSVSQLVQRLHVIPFDLLHGSFAALAHKPLKREQRKRSNKRMNDRARSWLLWKIVDDFAIFHQFALWCERMSSSSSPTKHRAAASAGSVATSASVAASVARSSRSNKWPLKVFPFWETR